MQKDYYVVLGVSRGADIHKIKKAYRMIVKKYHPDTAAGQTPPEKFFEARQAYEILSDEERRRQYDQKLQERRPPAVGIADAGVRPRRPPVQDSRRYASAADEFFEGFVPGFFPDYFEKGRGRGKDLCLEIILSPQEAHHGGLFPLTVPVREPCPHCGSKGLWDDFFCPVCTGAGSIPAERKFSLSIPPQVRHGTEIRLPLDDIGLRGVWVHVTVLIDPALDDELW